MPSSGANRGQRVPLSRIEALVSLLGDEDRKILTVAWEELERIGGPALPSIRHAARESTDERVKVQAQRFVLEWRRREVFREWVQYCRQKDRDLETGVFLLARTEDPYCDVERYADILDDYAATLRLRLSGGSLDDAMNKLRKLFFDELGYSGRPLKDYYRPENSYVNRVIDEKRGIPISLATVVLLVCRRLSLQVHGVCMPQHFLLKYQGDSGELFIDAFNRGRLLTVHDCVRLLNVAGVGFRDEHFDSATDDAILIRTLNNLFKVYWDQSDTRRAHRIAAMLKMLS